jgi:hypothetical protein
VQGEGVDLVAELKGEIEEAGSVGVGFVGLRPLC